MKILKISFIIHLLCCLVGSGLRAQTTPVVFPVPRQVTFNNQLVEVPTEIEIIGEGAVNAINLLKNVLQERGKTAGKLTIYLGKRGDKAVRKFSRKIPQQPEGYYLSLTSKCWIVAGNDDRGTYYAVQTLRQLLQQDSLKEIEIIDYPEIPFRGVVEGFYGTPWSHEARLRQLKFYGEQKLNTYIYGPKDDPYHSCPNWRKPYPTKEAEQIRELTRVAREYAVNFVWAIHPGQDIRWNEEDRKLLLDKFESMYELGVRSFAVFFDDISGEGANPEKQVALLNDIDNLFVKVKGDVTPLIMCPTEYNKSWSNPQKGYLTTLGKYLNPTIQVMWTGDRVISDITEDGLNWVNERILRPAYIWWNFPVSDYVRDHLLMGAVYGLDLHIGKQMSGFVTNPMEHAEASKIAIFSVADYAWNPKQFNSLISWKMAVKNIFPHKAYYLQCFVDHNSDLGPNGHGYRREESVQIEPVVSRFMRDYRQGNYREEDVRILQEEFERIVEAADVLMVSSDNEPLIKEIFPWLMQFENLGKAGLEVLKLVKLEKSGERELFLKKYEYLKALQQKAYRIDQTYNQNPYQPGVKSGSKVLQPLVDSLFVWATKRFNQTYGTELEEQVFSSPHVSYSSVLQCKYLPVHLKTNRVVVSPLLEVVKWKSGEYIGVELDQACEVQALEANFGIKECVSWLQLETSVDGENWHPFPMTQKNNVLNALLTGKVRYIRILNQSGQEKEVYLRRFIVVLNQEK